MNNIQKKKQIYIWQYLLIVVVIIGMGMLLGVLPGLELPSLSLDLWWGTTKGLVYNKNWLDFTCYNIGYPAGCQLNELYSVCFLTQLFLRLGMPEIFALSLCFFVLYCMGAGSLIYVLYKISGNYGLTILGFVLYCLVPILKVNSVIAPTYFGYLLMPIGILADYLLYVYFFDDKKIIYSVGLIGVHLFTKLLLVSTGWYLSVIYAVISCLVLQLLICFHIKKGNMRNVLGYELWFVGVGVITWLVIMYSIKLLVPEGTEEMVYNMERFNGSSVDLLTCFVPSATQKLSDYISIESFIPENMKLTGDSGFHSNYLGLALLICNFYGVINKNYRNKYNVTFLIAAGVMFVLSLGPALKICKFIDADSTILYSVGMEGQILFPWKFLWYIFPISAMRTTYRWIFGAYICLIINAIYIMAQLAKEKGNYIFIFILIIVMLVEYFPNDTYDTIMGKIQNYQMAQQQKKDICDELRPYVTENSVAVISNFGGSTNQYLSVIIASDLNIKLWNISGDKNLILLRGQWTENVWNIMNSPEPEDWVSATDAILSNSEADYVIFPTFDLQHDVYTWPENSIIKEERNIIMDFIEQELCDRYNCDRTAHYLIISQ